MAGILAKTVSLTGLSGPEHQTSFEAATDSDAGIGKTFR